MKAKLGISICTFRTTEKLFWLDLKQDTTIAFFCAARYAAAGAAIWATSRAAIGFGAARKPPVASCAAN